MLHISHDLSLPLEFVTQTQALLGKRGSGKTTTASVQAEELLEAKQQVVVVDPTGAWHGLRSSADGKSAGFPIVVMGGDHADVPLEENAGEVVATAIVENRFSAVLDVSLFRKAEMRRFLVPFMETLYRLNREPVHLFVDEADDVAPEHPFGDQAKLVGAMEDIMKRGRRKGIGCSVITQRPQALAKDVLTQCQILTVMRLTHPLDLKAVMAWVNVHADVKQAQEMLDSLPSLPVGTAYFWSPGWPNEKGIFEKVHVRARATFDSSATPKAGEKVRTPKVLAPVDVARLGAAIKATVEKAKANDPVNLKRKIAELEKSLAAKPAPLPVGRPMERIVEVPVLKNGQLDRTEKIAGRLETFAEKLTAEGQKYRDEAAELRRLIKPATAKPVVELYRSKVSPTERAAITVAIREKAELQAASRHNRTVEPAYNLPQGEVLILTAAAQYPDGVSKSQIAVLTGFRRSTRDAYFSRLSARGYVARRGDLFVATPEGVAALGNSFDPLPTGSALQAYWLERLPDGERKVLSLLVDAHPQGVPSQQLSEMTGYARSSRDAYVSRLAAKKLVERAGGEVLASAMLFD